ncbi:MAG: exosortase/archaeosortase family protein [Fibrobacter sp.]|nr:exosortase/archaeosortase family protein [Fibrobacter sp.]
MKSTRILYYAGYTAIAVLFGYAFREHFIVLFSGWAGKGGTWKYLVLPFVLVLIVSSIKKATGSIRESATTPGILFSLSGLLLAVLARLTLSTVLIETAPFVTLCGIFYLIEGKKRAEILFWPVWYFLFIVILSPAILPYVLSPLQKTGSVMATFILKVLGKEVNRYGNEIHLPAIILDVNPWCSGINQLLSILTLSIPSAFLLFRINRSRLLFISFSVIISIVLNGVRIALLGLWNYDTVREHVHGPEDIFLAPVIYPAALFFLFLCARIIRLSDSIQKKRAGRHIPDLKLKLYHFFIPAIFLLFCITVSHIAPQNTKNFVIARTPSHLRSESHFRRNLRLDYTDPNGFKLELRRKWYSSQTFNNRIDTDFSKSIHITPSPVTIATSENSKIFLSKLHYSENDSITVVVLFWFETCGKKTGLSFRYRINLLKNMLINGDNSAAVTTLTGKCPSSLHQQLLLERSMFYFLQKEHLLAQHK